MPVPFCRFQKCLKFYWVDSCAFSFSLSFLFIPWVLRWGSPDLVRVLGTHDCALLIDVWVFTGNLSVGSSGGLYLIHWLFHSTISFLSFKIFVSWLNLCYMLLSLLLFCFSLRSFIWPLSHLCCWLSSPTSWNDYFITLICVCVWGGRLTFFSNKVLKSSSSSILHSPGSAFSGWICWRSHSPGFICVVWIAFSVVWGSFYDQFTLEGKSPVPPSEGQTDCCNNTHTAECT